MRFLHTADWQVGMRTHLSGEAGKRVRGERLAAARRVIDVAKAHQVDFILVAGDVFEDNAIDRILVQSIANVLQSFGQPVLVIPGNHDPAVPGSVWEHPGWKACDNVRLLTTETIVPIPGGTLYACPDL